MFKKTLYLLLVGILLFQSFCPLPLLFAQEDEKPSIVSIEEENVDIYIDYEQDVDLLEESVEEEVFVEENIVVARTEIQTSSLDASTLKITEVFCFGADEWIEITNFGENTFY
ncbi:MAG: hypothetical protein LBD11_00795 [Candidatus Peribacteria bacterium]|jgi:hypothetical protein|nr:hypothetical protein [Candidatus Peribacteria bacterium]